MSERSFPPHHHGLAWPRSVDSGIVLISSGLSNTVGRGDKWCLTSGGKYGKTSTWCRTLILYGKFEFLWTNVFLWISIHRIIHDSQ